MLCHLVPIDLTDEQKGQVFGILSVGCDWQTAADFVGCSLAELRRAMQQDSAFAARVRRSEANVELMHMRIVQESATDKKNWRASIWWLERRSPERFARRAGVVTARQLKAFVSILVDIFSEEVRDAGDRQRLIASFNRVVASLEQMLRDSQPEWADESIWQPLTPPDMDAGLTDDEATDSAALDQ
ncbi:MAG: hypothetical protein L0228_18790 [Planctomycetes bacterium]|nr:hypothetical protein [Planctomycetota bacterium]